MSDSFDADLYHIQNIRWNEEFSAVPGLANLEDRFGFNSNYLLISALFSFRFLFGEAVYTLQSLLFLLIMLWVVYNIIASKKNVPYLLLLFFLIIILMGGETFLDNSSTDSVSLLCIFYYISKTALKPAWLHRQPLLAILLPITMVTYKLSSIIFCLICLYVLYYLVKQKRYKVIGFTVVFSFLLMSFWFTRNVIVSGYLIYPLNQIDLFNVDWKVPQAVAVLQQTHIYNFARFMFFRYYDFDMVMQDLNGTRIEQLYRLFNVFIHLLIVLSPLWFIYSYFKGMRIHRGVYQIYLVSVLSIIFGLITAPDFRFINGFVFGCSFLILYTIVVSLPIGFSLSLGARRILLAAFALVFAFVVFKEKRLLVSYTYDNHKEQFFSFIYKPMPFARKMEVDIVYDARKVGNLTIYTTREVNGRTYDFLPSTNPMGLPEYPFEGYKIQHIETIDSRGETLQDGFKTKPMFVDSLNRNIEIYKDQYIRFYKQAQPYPL
ncbi:hypothetical protein [Dysgonomonas sp. 511]|uniref:LIC_10190 family membrane protein n=1 Tax=Dysgonomonas sp. 511 TaxID=2302930 RepID=UPI0013D52772|nr:hypothetical protein [Dysgonomonas sp. 511]NDV79447.1 hypothetical protein [Dysgonomonas sp. 511]